MSSSPESIVMKQPIRRLEIQINNFNVAIPHHVDLLKQHKNNIKRYRMQQDWEKVHKEDINVSRIIKQLKELLYQMDTLRSQVLDSDINQFDKLTAKARTSLMNEIKEYMVLNLDFPVSESIATTEEEIAENLLDNRYIQLQQEHEKLQRQQTCLNSWNTLQNDIQQLHQLFVEFNKIVNEQKELVNQAEEDIEETQINVHKGEKYLVTASKYKVAAYPLAGAVIGTCIGGPIGLLAGMKIGGLAALGCGILGFTGGSLLKKKKIETHSSGSHPAALTMDQRAVKKSVSLPESLEQSKKEL